MKRINKHIEIVRSNLPGFSSMGLGSSEMIKDVLEKHYRYVGVTTVNNPQDLEVLVDSKPDLVFLGLKKVPTNKSGLGFSEIVWMSEYLESKGISYTGSNSTAIALDFNKSDAKQVVKRAGLKTSLYFRAKQSEYLVGDVLPLDFPLFIKPPNTGGGKGIDADSVARNFDDFERKVQSINQRFSSDSLVEEYLTGREFSVAILETELGKIIAMPIELITEKNSQGDRILGQKIKSDDTEHSIAIVDLLIKKKVIDLAINVFKALGARDYGRIDIRLDKNGVPNFLEANLIPGIASHSFTSYFNRACIINESMDYETMLLKIVALGISRADKLNTESLSFNDTDILLEPTFKALPRLI